MNRRRRTGNVLTELRENLRNKKDKRVVKYQKNKKEKL